MTEGAPFRMRSFVLGCPNGSGMTTKQTGQKHLIIGGAAAWQKQARMPPDVHAVNRASSSDWGETTTERLPHCCRVHADLIGDLPDR